MQRILTGLEGYLVFEREAIIVSVNRNVMLFGFLMSRFKTDGLRQSFGANLVIFGVQMLRLFGFEIFFKGSASFLLLDCFGLKFFDFFIYSCQCWVL